MISVLITPYATIISKGFCDNQYWSSRVDAIEYCEFFTDTNSCFNRLLALQKLSMDDYRELNELPIDEEKITHYRITNHKTRFEKIQRSFNVDGDIMIDWEDWHYDFYRKGDEYNLWVYLGGHADRTETIRLTNEQVNQYKQVGIEYIRGLVKQVK